MTQDIKTPRLSDDQIGRIWFEAKVPGLVESEARRLIRMAEAALAQQEQDVPEPFFGDMRPAAYRFRTRGVEDAQWRLTDDPELIRQMLELGHWEVRTLIEAPDVAGGAA